jgi:hypothetical protein
VKKITLISTIFILVSCTGLEVRRTAPVAFDSLFLAKVIERNMIVIAANESKNSRMLVGFLAMGIIGAIATSATEDDFSQPTVFEYKLQTVNKDFKTIKSRSIAEVGRCVMVISTNETKLDLLRVVEAQQCNTTLKSKR